MRSTFYSSIKFCAAISRPGACAYCTVPTESKWFDLDLQGLICSACFNPALDAEREVHFAGFRVPPASLCLANP